MEILTIRRIVLALLASALLCLPACELAWARSVDRVVAYVDDMAITQRTLEARYSAALKEKGTDKDKFTRFEALSEIIDKALLLREARKIKLTATSEDELVQKYIEFKVKALIIIREEEIKEYYDKNQVLFKKSKYSEARDRIKRYLENEEKMRRLKHHMASLRQKATIRILVEETAP